MCGRFTITAPSEQIQKRFDIDIFNEEEFYHPSFNAAPSQNILSVINDGIHNRLGFFKWGLVPFWAKDPKIGYKMINARSETLSEKPSFRNAYKKRRCIIVADSFYEWKRNKDQSKTPMRIKLKSNDIFAIAGLWETWKSPKNEVIHSCTIITTKPNELVKDIHDRMPVILNSTDEKTWLDTSISDTDTLQHLLKPYDAKLMEAYEVSTDVNSPKNNAPSLLERIR